MRRTLVAVIAFVFAAATLPACLFELGNTSTITLVSTSTSTSITPAGPVGWRYDFYRNTAYPCAISGYQTFLVITRVGASNTATAPLWVWMHGGGTGWFSTAGSPQPDSSSMSEETDGNLHDAFDQRGGLVPLVEQAPAGFRFLAVSNCARDNYLGTGQEDPYNPNGSQRTTNGMLATKAAIQFVTSKYPTSKYFLHGAGSGATGAYYLAYAEQKQGTPPAGVIGDANVLNWEQGLSAYTQGACTNAAFSPTNAAIVRARIDPAVANDYNDVDRLVSRGALTVPLLHIWNHGDTDTCGATAMQCRLADDTVITLGATDCNHRRLADAIAAQGPTSASKNLGVCVDVDATPDCSRHFVTTTDNSFVLNTDPSSPADYLGAIMSWVQTRLAGPLSGWGDNGSAAVGNGAGTDQLTPVGVGNGNWISADSGDANSVGVKADGTLWVWGAGQRCDGTSQTRTSPTQIGTDTNWVAASAGDGFTVALKANGTLWACGLNTSGQLGDGTTTTHLAPQQVGTDTDWTSVSAGHAHIAAIKADRTLWTWGDNTWGQLGSGNLISRTTPGYVFHPVDAWRSVSAGDYATYGVDGQVWAWGWLDPSVPGVGDSSPDEWQSPVQLSGAGGGWSSVAAGESFFVGVKTDGTLWSTGYNASGQLGDGTTTNRAINPTAQPVYIGGNKAWMAVAAGKSHALALSADGTLWSWGAGGDGQRGDGTTTAAQLSPVQIGAGIRWSSVFAGGNNSFALS